MAPENETEEARQTRLLGNAHGPAKNRYDRPWRTFVPAASASKSLPPIKDAKIAETVLKTVHPNEDKVFQRLEFLCDGYISYVTRNILFEFFPRADEGFLTQCYQMLVCNKELAALADFFGLSRPTDEFKAKADRFEAYLGGLARNGQHDEAAGFLRTILASIVEYITEEVVLTTRNPVTKGRYYHQAEFGKLPERLTPQIERGGPTPVDAAAIMSGPQSGRARKRKRYPPKKSGGQPKRHQAAAGQLTGEQSFGGALTFEPPPAASQIQRRIMLPPPPASLPSRPAISPALGGHGPGARRHYGQSSFSHASTSEVVSRGLQQWRLPPLACGHIIIPAVAAPPFPLPPLREDQLDPACRRIPCIFRWRLLRSLGYTEP
ncbi:hypothetical protein TWF696_004555 [Orbilia brochopaga]|uniref:RNase III domain-containing protein n=1 Tax=Orbilia brochopaga TaxID=3140254 RepID=A0AAV9V6Q2_9PEZI